MDPNEAGSVDAMIEHLFSYDPVERNAVINNYYADNVTYKHPLWNVEGPSTVKHVYDLWANLNAKPPKILDVVFDGRTCVVRTELLICPRVFPFVTFHVPATTVLKFSELATSDDPTAPSGGLYVTHQEDAWTIQDLIESVPLVGWWYKHIVIPAFSVLLLSASSAVKTVAALNDAYVHPVVSNVKSVIAQGQEAVDTGVKTAVDTGAKVAGAGYQVARDGADFALDKASEAAGRGYAIAKDYQLKAESIATDLGHEGARQAGVATGATRATVDTTKGIFWDYASMAQKKAQEYIGMGQEVLDQSKQKVQQGYEIGQQKAGEAADVAQDEYGKAADAADSAKQQAAADYQKGYAQGSKRGLFGLGSWWVDKTGARPYVDNAEATLYKGQESVVANAKAATSYGQGKYVQGKTYAQRKAQPVQAKLSETAGIASQGFEDGKGVGKDVEEHGPEYAAEAYGQGVDGLKKAAAQGIDATQDVLDGAKEGLDGAKEGIDSTKETLEEAKPDEY